MGLKHHHSLRYLTRLQASVGPLVVTEAMDINSDPSCYRAMGPEIPLSSSSNLGNTMATGGSTDYSDQHGPSDSIALGHQHGPMWQPRP